MAKGSFLYLLQHSAKGNKDVAPTYLLWHLDSKKIFHDVVYYDLIFFFFCMFIAREARWPILAEG